MYERDDGARRPALIMTHGFSATMTGMVADRYAEVVHAAGLTVLLFDHRGFGFSGGEPRLVLNRWTQMRGYRDALGYVDDAAFCRRVADRGLGRQHERIRRDRRRGVR